ASGCADTLFQEVLSRKDNADATRNALSVLQRFKFLFNLPLSIDRSVHKGDYDVVINDYEKAKSLFGSTEVRVFQKVYADVEVRIEGLRKLLLGKLLETPATLHDQKRYIRYHHHRRRHHHHNNNNNCHHHNNNNNCHHHNNNNCHHHNNNCHNNNNCHHHNNNQQQLPPPQQQ
ncbi:unnamed protein product, partial [Lampetra planeri]